MDIEGYAKAALKRGEPRDVVVEKVASLIAEVKNISHEKAMKFSDVVVLEAETTLHPHGLADTYCSGVSMGRLGVGSRGLGDFFLHSLLPEVIGNTGAVVDSSELDDSGVVRVGDYYLSVTVDGIHSRLSDFPFLSGFHVTRAALRDIYVMGSQPVAVLSDIHVADDGDISKVLEHVAGISAVCDVMDIPYVSGSTLRIGGDMVIGDRMTGGVGAVGVATHLTARRGATEGDVIILTEGAGGGTICTAALYNDMPDVVDETINVDFLRAADAIIKSEHITHVHAMTDVTNGGLRGDVEEISRVAGCKLVIQEEKARSMVNPVVLDMLEQLGIDYLGVSVDSLLVILPEDRADGIISTLHKVGVKSDVVGYVERGQGTALVVDGEEREFTPRFRESAYTPLKKVVGEDTPEDFEEMKEKVVEAARAASNKKNQVVKRLRERRSSGGE